MSRPLRLVLSSVLLLVALLAFRVALDGTVTRYQLPAPGGTSTRHAQVFAPGVAGAVFAGLAALGTLVWLVLTAVRRPGRVAWLVVAGLVLLDVVVVYVVSELPRPAF